MGTLKRDKIDFHSTSVTIDKEGHYIMIMYSIHQEDIAIININTVNTGELNIYRNY